jgi:hypothetical protein
MRSGLHEVRAAESKSTRPNHVCARNIIESPAATERAVAAAGRSGGSLSPGAARMRAQILVARPLCSAGQVRGLQRVLQTAASRSAPLALWAPSGVRCAGTTPLSGPAAGAELRKRSLAFGEGAQPQDAAMDSAPASPTGDAAAPAPGAPAAASLAGPGLPT